MPLHIIKLAVGAESVEDMQAWIDRRVKERKAAGERAVSWHETRMFPKRADEVLDGGSLYWVIKHFILVRQPILGLEEAVDSEGKPLCRIVLAPKLVRTEPRGKRPFQGWRYLTANDAPADLDQKKAELSPALVSALKDALAW
ncbi:MAG: DUF1489 domain-containing protein [Hyphomonadaceae bacterium]